MGQIEGLLAAYAGWVRLPWDESLSGPEKVWMAVYSPREERRLRARVGEFEMATTAAGHKWDQLDLTDEFARWLGLHEYRDSYFETPDALELALEDFGAYLIDLVTRELSSDGVDAETVVAIIGIGSLFGLYRASRLIEAVNDHIQGRLLVFFPGELQGSNYRLLEARDGWNYLAVPITPTEAGTR